MQSRVLGLFFFGLLTGTSVVDATCTRCARAQQKTYENAGVTVHRSKGWRPVSKAVKNKMTREERRTQRMNNKRKKAVPARTLRKQHTNVVKKHIETLTRKIDAMESLLASVLREKNVENA